MYQAHFGLKKPLFDNGIAQDAAVFLAPKHTEIAANCKLALTTSDSAIVLTGPAGVGKTTLMSAVLRNTSTRLALGWITVAPANAAELLELLLVELGFNAHRVGRVERVQMWRQFLNESSATSSRVYVIAERADELAPEILRAFDSLTAADPNGSLGANLVLLGQPALLDVLKSPLLDSLRQRIRLRQRLEPLTADELRAYLEHHAKLADSQVDKLFTRNAVAALHELSGGIPRLANNLCETALTLAATRNERLVAAEVLRHVAATMFGIEPPPTTRAGAPPAAAIERPATRAQTENKSSPAVERASADDRPSSEPIDTPAENKASAVVGERAATPPATPAPAPTTASVASEPASTRPASEPKAAPEPTPVIPASAPTHAAAPQPKSYPSGPPDPDLDAFADTLTDSPDVPMLDFPVLTDAVEPARVRPRADTAYLKPPVPQPSAAAAAKPATPLPRVVPAATAPPPAQAPRAPKPAPASAQAQAAPAPAALKPAAPPARPSQPAPAEDDDLLHQTQTMRGLMAAKSINDISDSMAETLFGEAELDMVSAALAASDWSDDDAAATVTAPPTPPKPATAPAAAVKPAAPATAPAPAPKQAAPAKATKPAAPAKAAAPAAEDPFDFLGLGPDAPLELIDDPEPAPAPAPRKEAARNR